MKYKLTDRQLMALLAVYHNQPSSYEASGVYPASNTERAGQIIWRARTNMGGAIRRMVETLQERNFITRGDHYSARDKPWYDRGGQLTSAGYEAIEERRLARTLPVVNRAFNKGFRDPASALPEYDFNDKLSLAELRERKAARTEREGEIKRLKDEEHAQLREQMRSNTERAKANKLAKLRDLFSARGLADNWSDGELLEFADRVASL